MRGVKVSPRDVVAAILPDPAELGAQMRGRTCAGSWVRGIGQDGEPREVYVYHVVDNAWSMREFGHQAVVWQTAVMPAVAIELMAHGVWSGIGIVGPEALPAQPFLDLLDDHGTEWEWDDYLDRAPHRTVCLKRRSAASEADSSVRSAQFAGVGEGVREGVGEGDALPGDVERGAVVDRRADDRQAERDVDAGVERQQLHRPVTLVVVHAHDRVVALAGGRPGRRRCRPDAVRWRRCPPTARRSIAGAMCSASSSPNSPCSPACGLSPQTAIRGTSRNRRSVASVSSITSSTRCGRTRSIASRSEQCVLTWVTRERRRSVSIIVTFDAPHSDGDELGVADERRDR